jgi:hypothetical protein
MKKFWLNYQNGRNYVKEEILQRHPLLSGIFLDFPERVFNLTLIYWKLARLVLLWSREVET